MTLVIWFKARGMVQEAFVKLWKVLRLNLNSGTNQCLPISFLEKKKRLLARLGRIEEAFENRSSRWLIKA